jgi:hypothetical protein
MHARLSIFEDIDPNPDSMPEDMKQARPSLVGLFGVIARDGV